MTNNLLDSILKSLRDDYKSAYVSESDFFEKHKDIISKREWNRARALLIRKELIRRVGDSFSTAKIQIKPEGDRFLEEGGFSGQAEYKDETLRVAKLSKIYAKWALIVAIISLIVMIFQFWIKRKP